MTEDMDALIRQAAGRSEPAANETMANPAATAEQLAAAKLVGVPVSHAHRLEGGDHHALVADGRKLLALLAKHGYTPSAAVSFDGGAAIRAKADEPGRARASAPPSSPGRPATASPHLL
jgi:hypothetical protein